MNQKADLAVYQSKDSGQNNYYYFHADMSNDKSRQLKIAQNLRHVLLDGQFSLHFQTKRSVLNQCITGSEALLRWYHPEFGNISPNEFIYIAAK